MTLSNFIIYVLPALFVVTLWAWFIARIMNNRKLREIQKTNQEILTTNKQILNKFEESKVTTENRKT